ncbi:MAG: thioredoxin family protein [Candidatus Micrarchaeia archaeon]
MAIVELDDSSFPACVLDSKGKAVVFFYSPWSQQSKAAEPMVEQVSGKIEGVEFFKVDADRFQSIANKYWIGEYPTIVIFKSGRPLADSLIEPKGAEQIEAWLSKRL